ncbi:DUF4259 domain-containing protein [Glycomyces salinus]|nr:DUF4259 domain-containing protein [Glycomyces salinus]
MGAWGMGPFENDGALDCVADPSGTAAGLGGAMREVTDTEEYEDD